MVGVGAVAVDRRSRGAAVVPAWWPETAPPTGPTSPPTVYGESACAQSSKDCAAWPGRLKVPVSWRIVPAGGVSAAATSRRMAASAEATGALRLVTSTTATATASAAAPTDSATRRTPPETRKDRHGPCGRREVARDGLAELTAVDPQALWDVWLFMILPPLQRWRGVDAGRVRRADGRPVRAAEALGDLPVGTFLDDPQVRISRSPAGRSRTARRAASGSESRSSTPSRPSSAASSSGRPSLRRARDSTSRLRSDSPQDVPGDAEQPGAAEPSPSSRKRRRASRARAKTSAVRSAACSPTRRSGPGVDLPDVSGRRAR